MATETLAVSSHTVDKVNKAKVTLENYYSQLVCQHEERESRLVVSDSSPPGMFQFLTFVLTMTVHTKT